MILGCSSNNTYKLAQSFYKKKNFAVAITFYDKYIKDYGGRAEATLAELERSSCYYNLGLKAYKNKDYKLASKFFFLSNSDMADSLLDNCYYHFAEQSLQNNDIDSTLKYFSVITENFPKSELIPKVLFEEIKIYLLLNQKKKAYEKYDLLCTSYKKSKYVNEAEKLINDIIPYFMDEISKLETEKKYDEALKKLFYIEKNPSSYESEIARKIANIYMELAEESIKEGKYVKAKAFLGKAQDWDSSLKQKIKQRLLDIVDLFIKKGDLLVKQEKLDEAIKNYMPVFDIIPNYKQAEEKIAFAKKLKEDFALADSLYKKAKDLEEQKKYKSALQYYNKSYKLHKREFVHKDIIHMKNILRANKEPKVFAKEIVENYKNGIILKNLENLKRSLKVLYKNDMKDSGWQIFYSFGKYKFEVRYDITTSEKTYYFIWRVNLEYKTISPLNKISREYMGVIK